MLDTIHVVWLIAAGFIALMVQLFTAAWILRGFLAGLEASIMARTQSVKDEMALKLELAIKERDGTISTVRHEVGEVGHALRTKIHDVELHLRDHYVDKADFKLMLEGIRDQFTALNSNLSSVVQRMESRFEAFATKLDRL